MIVFARELRKWIGKIAATRPSPRGKQDLRSAGEVRDDRASSVIALQKEVRALQQDITNLIEAPERRGTGGTDTDHEAQLASLRSRLTQKQADLARFQARV
jgi:hypothetical protein